MAEGIAPPPAAPAPAPAPDPVIPTEPKAGQDAWAALDALGVEENAATIQDGKPQPKPAAEATPEPTAEESPAPEEKPDPKAADKPEQKPERAGELKRQRDRLKVEVEEWKAKHAALEKQSKEPKEDPEKKTLAERAEAAEKRIQDYERRMQLSEYRRSDEFQIKFQKPFDDAYNAGRKKVSSMTVLNDDGTPRKGTDGDFDEYAAIQDEDAAADFAERRFGNKKSIVEYHRLKAADLATQLNLAVESHEKFSENHATQTKAQAEKMQAELSQAYQEAIKFGVEKYARWFNKVDGDAKGNELLDKGYHLADRAFTDGRPLKEGDQPMNSKELAQLRAVIRNKAGAFDRLTHQLSEERKLRKAAEKKAADFEASEGTQNGLGTRKVAAALDDSDWKSRLNKYAK